MKTYNIQATRTFKQINIADPDKVFPLLCPVREKEWLDGWEYKMIYSKSGLIEKGCVFTTPHHGEKETIWNVSHYDKANYEIIFVRLTPEENVVKISIKLNKLKENCTEANIEYQYTALNEKQLVYLNNEQEADFEDSMKWWEKAINYFLKNGKMLEKASLN